MRDALTFVSGPIRGELTVPGDKSVSHRALIAAACARQPISISNLNPGRDVRATRVALGALGVPIDGDATHVSVSAARLRVPATPLD